MISRLMQHRWFKYTFLTGIVLLPIIAGILYATSATAIYRYFFFPKKIVILTGSEGGRYRQIGKQLKATIERDLNIAVELPASNGSVDNLAKLNRNEAHFAFYQPGAYEALKEAAAPAEGVRTIANLYSQPLHLIVRQEAGIQSAFDLKGKKVHIGLDDSGDYAMCRVLLNHVGISEDEIIPKRLTYAEVVKQFAAKEIDAAFITLGLEAPVFQKLFAEGNCHLLSLPHLDALMLKELSLSKQTIPAGYYRTQHPIEPEEDLKTIAQGAQLICREALPLSFVSEIARIVTSEEFMKSNRLGELAARGIAFAEHKPEFQIHPGAKNFYHSEFDVQVFEGWEALYSLLVSMLIAAFLFVQTLKKFAERNKEHKLDQYVRRLLLIERSQLDLDQSVGSSDIAALQRLLDEVTQLRQQALQEFTAHEINEDRAVDSFIEMCHALNNKINAKLSRQRMDRAIQDLVTTIREVQK